MKRIYLNDGVVNPMIIKTIKVSKSKYYSDEEIMKEFLHCYEDPLGKIVKLDVAINDDTNKEINTNRMYYSDNNKNVYQLLGFATDSFGNILDNVFKIRNVGIIIEE